MLERQLKSILKKKKGKRASSAGWKKKSKVEKLQKRNFERQFNGQQLQRMLWKDKKQLSIQEKIYKLASYLETNKMLEENRRLKEKKKLVWGRKRVN